MAISSVFPSAGVYVREIDLSTRIQAVSSSIGAIIGESSKGPVNETTLITSVREFIDVFGKPNPKLGFMHYAAIQFLEASSRLYVTRVIKNALTAGAYLTVDDLTAAQPIIYLTNFDDGSNQPLGVVNPLDNISFRADDPAAEHTILYFCAINPGSWNNEISIRVRPSNPKGYKPGENHDPYEFHVDVFLNYKSVHDAPVESFLVSRDHRIDGFGNQMYIEEVINNRSQFIKVKDNLYCPPVKILKNAFEFLDGANNGERVSVYDIANAWELYRDTEQMDINILINGGYTDVVVHRKMDEIAQDRMDCIAVLDMPINKQSVADAVAFRRNDLNLDSSYSALYTPNTIIFDPYNDIEVSTPISGLVAAAYAKTDSNAALWFAPAGLNRGQLNILKIAKIYNQGARDALDGTQINMVRFIPGHGYAIWNQATLQSRPSATQNVNVRRLMNFLEKSISITALYSVFEPNDSILRANLVQICRDFLEPIQNARGLYGYEVICDESNNPPEIVAGGDLILDVYVDPVIPAKRIHLRATITKTGASFREE